MFQHPHLLADTPTEYYATLKSEEWSHALVRFHLKAPVMITHPWINFDGLVAHMLLRLTLGQDYYTLPSNDPLGKRVRALPMPIRQTYFYHSSVVLFKDADGKLINVEERANIEYVYKRFHEPDAHKIGGKKSKISLGSGTFKNYSIRIPYISARYADVFVEAKPYSLLSLIAHVTGLGKKTAYGFGEINHIEIKPNPDKASFWNPKTKEALRPIPTRYCEEYDDFAYLAWKPPYWDRRNIDACVPVGAKCELSAQVKQKIGLAQ